MYILGDDEVGTGKFRSGVIKKFFPEKVELFNRKKSISNALYNEKLAQIEKKLTPAQLKKVLGGETSIKKFMAKQTDKLKEIFDVSNLDEGLKFNLDHAEGIAEIAKMNNKKDIMRGLQNLIGTTQARNYELGWKGYSTQRKNLINLIDQGINVEDNLKELNEVTKAAYPETKGKDAYKFVNNKITPTKNFRFLFNPQKAFQQYFTEIAGTEKGLKELQTQSLTNPQLKNIIESDPNLKKLVADKFATQKGFISPELLGADKLAKAAKLYGPAAGKIAQTTLRGASGVVPFETLFLGDYQQQGFSPQEMALNVGTLGVGTIFKDIKEKADYVKSKGLGDALQSAFRKQTIAQQARPVAGAPEGIYAAQPLTDDEQRALTMFNTDAQNIIDMRRAYQAGEYEKLDEAFGRDDPILRTGAMNGGIMRLGFADGPSDPSKRKFIKVMGGLASIPILGKFIKPAAKVAPAVVESFKGAPEWFGTLVNKVIKTGVDATKRFATKDREEVYEKFMGEQEGVRVYRDLETGDTRVQYFAPDNMGGDSVDLVYKAPEKLENGKIVPSEFKAVEAEPRGVRSGPDDYDIEFDGENVVESVDDLMSDTSRLEEFATGKPIDLNKAKIAKEKRNIVGKLNEDQVSQAEYLETKYGPGDYD